MDWTYSQAIGWVRVQVRDTDEDAARELLAADLTGQLPPADGEPDPCPSCATEWHYVEKASRRLLAVLILTAYYLVLALLFVIGPLWRSRLLCRSCRTEKVPIHAHPSRALVLAGTAVVGCFLAFVTFAVVGWLFVFLFDLSSGYRFNLDSPY